MQENDQSLFKEEKESAVEDQSSDLSVTKETDDLEDRKQMQLAKLYLYLGHFYLLLYDYQKALNAYQKFATFKIISLQVSELIS